MAKSAKTPVLDTLAAMHEEWHAETVAMVDMAVGMTLARHGLQSMFFTNDDMVRFLKTYRLERVLTDDRWTIRIIKREVASGEASDVEV